MALSVRAEENLETDVDQKVCVLRRRRAWGVGERAKAVQMSDVGITESDLSFIKLSSVCPEIRKY